MTFEEFIHLKIGEKIYTTDSVLIPLLEEHNISNEFEVCHTLIVPHLRTPRIYAKHKTRDGSRDVEWQFDLNQVEPFYKLIEPITDEEVTQLFNEI